MRARRQIAAARRRWRPVVRIRTRTNLSTTSAMIWIASSAVRATKCCVSYRRASDTFWVVWFRLRSLRWPPLGLHHCRHPRRKYRGRGRRSGHKRQLVLHFHQTGCQRPRRPLSCPAQSGLLPGLWPRTYTYARRITRPGSTATAAVLSAFGRMAGCRYESRPRLASQPLWLYEDHMTNPAVLSGRSACRLPRPAVL